MSTSEFGIDPASARKKLESAASLHWIHGVVISLSLLLTYFAWAYSKSSLDARVASQFDREAVQVVELILERMQKYEDALWSGVALIDSSGGDVDFEHWRDYANSINIENKYPGINGIGVIHAMSKADVPHYLSEKRKRRPDFNIYPDHDATASYPIAYIIPVKGNEQAVGLDMAHETNRFIAANRARDTGAAQITGPISLVQESAPTAGFLFYAPFYQGGRHDNASDSKNRFSGLVYAPFIVKKLMQGTLEKEKRQVGIRLTDGEDVLYDEHVITEADFDPDPLFKQVVELPLYGRAWTLDIWSAQSFRKASTDNQPWVILTGGLLLDALLALLFISISRASQKALGYANSMTRQLEANAQELRTSQTRLSDRASELETSNAELEQFAYVASHDLQEPLRKVTSFCQMLKSEYAEEIDDDGKLYIDYAVDGALRMKHLVTDLLSYSRVKSQGKQLEPTDAAQACEEAIANLDVAIEESGTRVTVGPLPEVAADRFQLVSLFQNLIGNAVKYHSAERTSEVDVTVKEVANEYFFCVRDNGIGIEPHYFEKIFDIFQRLHARDEYSGTGIGLAVCKRIVDRFGGRMWVESEAGKGSQFYFTLPTIQTEPQHGVLQDEFSCSQTYAEAY